MENDQYAYRRHYAPFYPFQDQAEFELGKFLCERLTQSDMERFLKLEWVYLKLENMGYSKDQLLAWVASLPTGPKWCSMTLEITRYPTVQSINLIWHNGLEVVQDLFANPIFANHMTYDPHIVVDGDKRKYSEYFMAQQAFEIQDQLPEGATIVPMIIASDKTPVTWHTEGLEMHPIFVTISNIQSDVWMRATYLPEQQAIACVSKVTSPITLATSQSFGDTYRHPPRTKEHTLAVIYDICQCIDPWRLQEFQEEAKAHSLSGIHQPF
ncbi:hypothetical protein BDR07DRAFT_1383624 [Suillus spraguei]|nr:hypothetical protein BDR07DRAFT_1383624 [Suillus spraguei]